MQFVRTGTVDQRFYRTIEPLSTEPFISDMNVNMGTFLHGAQHAQSALNIRVIHNCLKTAWDIPERLLICMFSSPEVYGLSGASLLRSIVIESCCFVFFISSRIRSDP
ncbi:hypothetical protein T10_2954 [Trichinella papuae]|uniref:Uncharacterized protein n=1 Tax=Trichinella papuae TaxID=268474 RepID=A0A0V1MKQ5_9BILA|nr:hypothetical protein T10_2954 [Trichinella papuae]